MGSRLRMSGSPFVVAPAPTQGSMLFGRKVLRTAEACHTTSNGSECSHPRKQVWWSLPKLRRISILLVKAVYNLQQSAVPVARNSKIRQAKEGDRSDLRLDREAGGWEENRGRGSLQSRGACLRSAWSRSLTAGSSKSPQA